MTILSVNINNDLLALPTPVPVLNDNFTILDSVGLPDPVPAHPSVQCLQTNEVSVQSQSVETVPIPTEAEMKTWSVKKLKSSLGDAGLHQYGLKNDLVLRLLEFYTKNPSKVPKPPLSNKDIVTQFLNSILDNVIMIAEMKEARKGVKITVDDGHGRNVSLSASDGVYSLNGKQIPILGGSKISVDDGSGKNVSISASDGVYLLNGKEIPILGASSVPKTISVPPPSQIITDPIVTEREKIMKKIGEIKSFEKLNLEFFKNGNSIMCTKDIVVGPREKKIVTFKLSELDLFASELAGRRVLIKERDNDRDILTIHKQISNIVINERKSEVDVLVENSFDREVTVKSSDKVKLIRVYLERTAKDLDHQFDIPEDDDVLDDTEDLLESEALDAATTNDIVLLPKTYHTEVCSVKLKSSLDYNPFVLMERTKASSMQIGMRKLIIIPKVLCYLNTSKDSCEATLNIKMYNASKQTLRITKKTKIAQVSSDFNSECDRKSHAI